MVWVSDRDDFSQIEQSLEKPQISKKIMKQARNIAHNSFKWIEPYDVNWKGKLPKLFWKPVPYYADDVSEPIAYEWKIACFHVKDCGSITVASLNGEYQILETSTYGKANYERLWQAKQWKKNKLYYYSPVDQYIESLDVNWVKTVEAINPWKKYIDVTSELYDEKSKIELIRKKGKLKFHKDSITSPQWLIGTWTITANLPWTSLWTCGGPLPCYNQFSQSYNGTICLSWCGPTALAIIFGYYDRNGAFPNLLPCVVASSTIADISMVNSIRGYMWTVCSGWEWATGFWNLGLGMQYARNRGYTNSANGILTSWTVWAMMLKVKAQINAGKPIIVNYGTATIWHIMAAYGFQTNAAPTPDDIHVNFWWWGQYPDKYLPSAWAITSAQAGNGNPVIWMNLISVVTVPIQ